ncbi:hypothetical protein BDB01DRAFT_715149 [Pilobolus umbonatus]|nr:hypothetical protein BDB01DRAFT_715149 [Pilobolus umbonatus]
MPELNPPFLVRTRTREERESMREQFKEQEKSKKRRPFYRFLLWIYSHFSFSFLLENKAATARDHLANERTFLAWLRTSLALITVGVAITQLYNLSIPGSTKPEHVQMGKSIGAAFVIFSMLFLYFANVRYFHTQIALMNNQFPSSRGAVLFGSLAIFSVLMAMFIIILLDMH